MRPNPHQFAAFAHAAREGSFSKAAERLGLSQSAISQHVANLERRIGAPLLLRDRKGLTLTRAGEEFFDLADRLVTLDQLIVEKVEGFAALQSGHLSIIANAPRPALGFIAAYQRLYPGIELDFTLWDWTSSMRLLRDRQVDVAIVTEPDRIGDCIVHEIGRARYEVYMREDHRLAPCPVVSLTDLAAETVLLPETGSFTQRVFSRVLRERGLACRSTLQMTTFPLMKEAALHGVGVGIFLDDSMHPTTHLVTRPIAEMPETYATCLVAPADKVNLRSVQSFIDLARDRSSGSGASQEFHASDG